MCCLGVASARNVDLSTVPKRDTVQLTIYNSEDLTLVRETRKVTFKKGVNPLQFSWANTLIDPTSVELRSFPAPDKLEVLDTTYPHDKPQMLYWNVQSDFDGDATIEITYFTSGITWTADYLSSPTRRETRWALMALSASPTTAAKNTRTPMSGSSSARSTSSRKSPSSLRFRSAGRTTASPRSDSLRRTGCRRPFGTAENAPCWPAAQPARPEPKQIIKEGLSEYFIYTIEGTETIHNGWSKRLRSLEAATCR